MPCDHQTAHPFLVPTHSFSRSIFRSLHQVSWEAWYVPLNPNFRTHALARSRPESCAFPLAVSTHLVVIFESLHCSLCRLRSEGFSDSFSCCFAFCLSYCFVFSISAIQSTENLCLSRIAENLDRQAPKVQIARHSEGASSTLSRTLIAPYMFVNSMGS